MVNPDTSDVMEMVQQKISTILDSHEVASLDSGILDQLKEYEIKYK
jgi:trimethylamine--corrinoid protein Co-methyltransferase